MYGYLPPDWGIEKEEPKVVTEAVKKIVKEYCNLPPGFEPVLLSCVCGDSMDKLPLAGASEQDVHEWFTRHRDVVFRKLKRLKEK